MSTRLGVMGWACAALVSAHLDAAPSTTQPNRGGPQEVYVGVYLLDVSHFDMKENSYIAELNVWFRWRGDTNPTDFEFMNGTIISKDQPDSRTIDGANYLGHRCRVEFHSSFDLRAYPFDTHCLTIELEDTTHDVNTIVYVADSANTAADPQVHVSGFNVGILTCAVKTHTYQTNYGIPSRDRKHHSAYSRCVCCLPLSHGGLGAYLKTFLACFISVGIAMLAFAVRPTDDPRFGVAIGGVFGVVSSYFVVLQSLPEVSYLTLVDKIHLTGLFFVFLSLLVSCGSLQLVHHDRAGVSRRLDRRLAVIMPCAFAAIVAYMSIAAMRH